MYEVAIIGCGPAGLMAARELKKENIKFIGLEARETIGEPLRCGEGIRKKDFLELFQNEDYEFVLNEAGKHKIIFEKERILHEPYLELDKPSFEKWLSKPVKEHIKTGTTCKDITKNEECIEITTTKGKIKTKIAILASGPNYILHKKIGLIDKYPKTTQAYGGIYKNLKIREDTNYFHLNPESAGYFWVFPKKDGRANMGYGGTEINVKEKFKELMKKYGYSNLKMERELGGVLPSEGPLEKTYEEGILVAGAAAGFVHSGTGEGNYFALKSGNLAGRIAAEAIKTNSANKTFLNKYEKEWKKEIGERLETGKAFALIERIGRKFGILEEIYDKISEKTVIDAVIGKTSTKTKMAIFIIKNLNLESPNITKESLRFKIFIKIFRAMHKMRSL